MSGFSLILTCEHGGNDVPSDYADLFRSRRARAALATHRGVDLGALALARSLQRRLVAPLVAATVTRLLVDLNRSPHHPRLFSEFSGALTASERWRVLERYHRPHRDRVRALVARHAPVFHVAVHSFTPRLDGETRNADIGLLYDPARAAERTVCRAWQRELEALRVRRNYPYRGTADGLPTTLRRELSPDTYAGVELEVNQGLLTPSGRFAEPLIRTIADALASVLR